jgi:hypothetical protein
MLDGAFFSKKSHPSRLLVNALAHAGIGWSPTMGHEDPLYRKIEAIVHRVLEEFSEDIGLFDELRADLEKFLEEEDKSAEAQIQSSAEEIDQRDRLEIAQSVAHAEVELRLRQHATPDVPCGVPGATSGLETLTQLFARWRDQRRLDVVAFFDPDDLIWSVQPGRARAEERKRLVAMLRNLLRLQGGLVNIRWSRVGARFMTNLVGSARRRGRRASPQRRCRRPRSPAHAAAAAEEATAMGDVETAAKARNWPSDGAGPRRRHPSCRPRSRRTALLKSPRRSTAACGRVRGRGRAASLSPSWHG